MTDSDSKTTKLVQLMTDEQLQHACNEMRLRRRARAKALKVQMTNAFWSQSSLDATFTSPQGEFRFIMSYEEGAIVTCNGVRFELDLEDPNSDEYDQKIEEWAGRITVAAMHDEDAAVHLMIQFLEERADEISAMHVRSVQEG